MADVAGPQPDRAAHWDATYGERGDNVSWFQAEPLASLELIDALGIDVSAAVVDVGGGASSLVDALVARRFSDITVLDISRVALDRARSRLRDPAGVQWVTSDVVTWQPGREYGLWHDRAVFHFLTDEGDRDAYLATLQTAVPTGGVIISAFAPDGPDSCSGLPVARYGVDELAGLFAGFDVVEARRDVHVTPWGVEQPFSSVALSR